MFGKKGSGNGLGETSYGLPRFQEAEFEAKFPFASVRLSDPEIPVKVALTGWSPFIPGDADNSSLPVGALEYAFSNSSPDAVDAVFSFNSQNFMSIDRPANEKLESIRPDPKRLHPPPAGDETESGISKAHSPRSSMIPSAVVVDHCWFRGGWFDPLTVAWKHIQEASLVKTPPVEGKAPGASLFVPFTLKPGETKTIRLMLAWYRAEHDASGWARIR